MKSPRRTGKSLLGALAFANVGNISEFNKLLLEPAGCESAPKKAEHRSRANETAIPAGIAPLRWQETL